MADATVLIGPSSFAELDATPLARLGETGCRIIRNPFNRKLTKPELLNLLGQGVTGVVAGLEPFDREVMEKSQLKVISRCGAGLSNVDLAAARELGIVVCSTPDAPTTAVAEMTLGAMLSLLRMIPEMDGALHQGRWTKKIGVQLEGKTVVVVGYGRIGRKVATLLGAFNARVLAVDPEARQVGQVPVVSLREALPQADIVTLHCSGDTCVLGPSELSAVKRGVFILNAARGGLIDEGCLVSALEDGHVAGAWLDTFEQEPYNGPLRNSPNVLLTPHVGSYTRECRKRMEMEAVENLIGGLARSSGA